ncbi:MAG TPA: hypothetical protein VEL28_02615 [Candidatus Binatia bacterium]|nr:hypothetical protein [Candidatus Binatia bacterium]
MNPSRLTASVSATAIVLFTSVTAAAVCGDVSGDGEIRSADALRVLRASVGQQVNLICDECDEALSVVRGTIGQNGVVLAGEGFEVNYIPAGSGGSLTRNGLATDGSTTISLSNGGVAGSGIGVDTYVLVDGTSDEQFYRVVEILDSTHIRIDMPYRGTNQASEAVGLYVGAVLFPRYEIEFDDSFEGRPSVTLSVESPSVQGSGEGLQLNSISIDYSAGGVAPDGSGFAAFLSQNRYPLPAAGPSIPGPAPYNWSFIAIGAR